LPERSSEHAGRHEAEHENHEEDDHVRHALSIYGAAVVVSAFGKGTTAVCARMPHKIRTLRYRQSDPQGGQHAEQAH
jgi:hypothetical protein